MSIMQDKKRYVMNRLEEALRQSAHALRDRLREKGLLVPSNRSDIDHLEGSYLARYYDELMYEVFKGIAKKTSKADMLREIEAALRGGKDRSVAGLVLRLAGVDRLTLPDDPKAAAADTQKLMLEFYREAEEIRTKTTETLTLAPASSDFLRLLDFVLRQVSGLEEELTPQVDAICAKYEAVGAYLLDMQKRREA